MVETPRELRKICQSVPSASSSWYVINVQRRLSIYITWLLLHTPISANQVTVLFIIIGLIGALFLTFGTKWYFVSGAFLLLLYGILDCVDGEIARYRKTESSTGIFLELMGHNIVDSSVFVCLSFGIYRTHHNVIILILGFIATISRFLAENRHEIVKRSLEKHVEHIVNIKPFSESAGVSETDIKYKGNSLLSRLVKRTHIPFLFTKGIDLVILFTALIDYAHIALIFYGITMPLRTLLLILQGIRQTRRFDSNLRRIGQQI